MKLFNRLVGCFGWGLFVGGLHLGAASEIGLVLVFPTLMWSIDKIGEKS